LAYSTLPQWIDVKLLLGVIDRFAIVFRPLGCFDQLKQRIQDPAPEGLPLLRCPFFKFAAVVQVKAGKKIAVILPYSLGQVALFDMLGEFDNIDTSILFHLQFYVFSVARQPFAHSRLFEAV